MRKKLGWLIWAVLFAAAVYSRVSPESFLSHSNFGRRIARNLAVQEFPPQKPKYDYMSSFYSRNTRPLGLKEDVALRRLMRQPTIKWVVRARMGHILN